jgi:asparagine synthase (glutamine-hydrolysing)
VSRSPDLYVNEHAREIAPVRMTGNYGSEVLRGVRAFKPVAPLRGLFREELGAQVGAAAATYARLRARHPLSFIAFHQAPWHHHGLLALEETQLSVRTPYLDNDLVRTLFQSADPAPGGDDVCLRLIADGAPALRAIPTDRGLIGGGRHLQEFLFKAEYAYDYGMPQWLARVDRLLSPLRPERLFLGRHKFYHFRTWYRRALAGYVREMLLDPRTLARPYLDARRLQAVVSAHTRGEGNYTTAIHTVLTLELVHRLFVDGR